MSNWAYLNDKSKSLIGNMICKSCCQEIHNEAFKYRLDYSSDIYVTIHRKCCPHETAWIDLDSRDEGRRLLLKLRLDAFLKFKSEWATDALDGEICDMQKVQQ